MKIDITIVADQEAFLVDAPTPQASPHRWIQAKVLLAMGLSRDAAFEAVRFSLGRFTTDEDIDAAVERTVTAVEYVRVMNRESR